MGSTVILLFEPNQIGWHPLLCAGAVVKLGQTIGHRAAAAGRAARLATGGRP
jgi:hypothetical protein